MREKSLNEHSRFQSRQYRCVQCGFQTTSSMFDRVKAEDGTEIYACSECGSREILDFDTRRQVNPQP